MHTLFTLEDLYGLRVEKSADGVSLRIDRDSRYLSMAQMLASWAEQSEQYRSGKITKEEYDLWRYNYPRIEAEQLREKLDVMRKTTE